MPWPSSTTSQRQWKDAERCFQQIIAGAQDQAAYNRLAELYYHIGENEKCTKVREESLKVPATFQERITARTGLTWNYRRAKNYPAACLQADQLVAESGSWTIWILKLAAACYEEAGDWDKTQEYHRQAADIFERTPHYQGPQKSEVNQTSLDWYFWCRRTGRGDVEAARKFINHRIVQLTNSNEAANRGRAGVYYYCEEDFDKALEHFRWAFNAEQDPYWGIQAALIADEMGNAELRDTLLSDALQAAVRLDHSLVDLIHDLRNALASPAVPLNLPVAEWRLRVLSGGQPTNHWYYLGKFLAHRGESEEAQRLLKLAAGSPASDLFTTTMAGVSLVRDGIRPQPIRAVELDDEQPRIAQLVQSAYDHLKKKEYDKAHEILDRALARSPQAVTPLYVRGRIAEDQKQYEAAIADYSKCLKQVPESVDLLCHRGSCHEHGLDYPAAIKDYQRAMELDPHYGTPQLALAMLRASCAEASQRDGAEALKLAQAAYVAERLPPWSRDHALALACAAASDFDAATKHGLEAVKRSPPESRKLTQDCLDLYRKGKVYVQKVEKVSK